MLRVNEEITIPEEELLFSYSRSSGPGGQNANKVNSRAQLRWSPGKSRGLPAPVLARFLARFGRRLSKEGDLVLASDESRDQRRNQEICREKLRAMLEAVARPPKKRIRTKPGRAVKKRRAEAKQHRSHRKRERAGGNWE